MCWAGLADNLGSKYLPNHIKNQIRNLSLKKVKEEVFNLFGEIKGENKGEGAVRSFKKSPHMTIFGQKMGEN